ncbi:MAG: hypothetical protein Q7T51_03265 [Candidatus Moranbacteria bacterium]|nr:hypothetical protein [Candidatus Moranbacteria bacterium]
MKSLNDINLLKQARAIVAAKGSLLAEIFVAMANDSSIDEPSVVEPGDKPLGVMNGLEKAIHFIYRRYLRKAEDLLGDMQAAYQGPADVPADILAKYNLYATRANAAHEIMWDTVQARFGEQEISDYTNWRVRANNQIILCAPKEKQGLPLSVITNALEKIFGGGITVVKVSEK